MLHVGYDRKCSIEKKNGRELQEAWRQDELIDSDPLVVK
jgi:hypothetical protein